MTGLKPLVGIFRRFRAFVLRREVEIAGQCNRCGRCCRDLLLKDEGVWLRSGSQYRNLLESAPEHTRFVPTGTDDLGFMTFTCTCRGNDNLCTDYENRPAMCSNYPSKSLYYQGGWLRADCGYSFQEVTFRDILPLPWRKQPVLFSTVLHNELEQDTDTQ